MKEVFRKISSRISNMVGSAYAFLLAFAVVVVWGITGPMFGYSDTWQLVINTGTTIVTFLMVFLIQNTQNRDSKSLHLKLDELIHSHKGARDSFLDLDSLSDEELAMLDNEFKDLHTKLGDAKEVHRLHAKIAKEKERRIGLDTAGKALSNISNILKSPLPNHEEDNKKSKK